MSRLVLPNNAESAPGGLRILAFDFDDEGPVAIAFQEVVQLRNPADQL